MIKKLLLGLLGSLALFGSGAAAQAASTATPTDLPGWYETTSGVKFRISNPGNRTYTGIEPDEPESGFNVYTKKNCDVGVQVTYDAETDKSTYLYDYIMRVDTKANETIYRDQVKGYWMFDLGNNKITSTDDYDYYVINTTTNQEYLVSDIENKNPSYFTFYASDLPDGSYKLKIVVKGNKTMTMNGVDIIEELSGENAVFGENGAEGESPCRIPTSNTVYDYFYYNFSDNESTATTAEEKIAEFATNTGIHIYDGSSSSYLKEDILGGSASEFNHEGHLYKHYNNCSFFLYTNQDGNYPSLYVNGIFEQGLLSSYFYDATVEKGKEVDKVCGLNWDKYRYDYATYLKNGHTSEIDYYTLSLKYSYKVYTPKNYEEMSFNNYMQSVANKMANQIDYAYEAGIQSKKELIDSLNQEIQSLNEQLTTKEQEKTALLNTISLKNLEIQNYQDSLADKQQELDSIEAELNDANNQVSVLTSQIQEKEEQLASLESTSAAEIEKLRNQIEVLTVLKNNATSKVNTLTKQNDELVVRINENKHVIATLQSDIDSKQEEIANLNQSVLDIKKQVTEKETEIETLERVISFQDDKITGLEQEIEDNRFFSTKGYWKKLFDFKNVEKWNVWNWVTWIGLGLALIVGLVVFVRKNRK